MSVGFVAVGIVVGGTTSRLDKVQKADLLSAKCFLCSVYMQIVVLGPSARIFPAERT